MLDKTLGGFSRAAGKIQVEQPVGAGKGREGGAPQRDATVHSFECAAFAQPLDSSVALVLGGSRAHPASRSSTR